MELRIAPRHRLGADRAQAQAELAPDLFGGGWSALLNRLQDELKLLFRAFAANDDRDMIAGRVIEQGTLQVETRGHAHIRGLDDDIFGLQTGTGGGTACLNPIDDKKASRLGAFVAG